MEDTQIKVVSGSISNNFDEVRKNILATLEEFEGAVFTGEDSIKYAKKIVADLRKRKTSLSDDIKTHKKEYMKPWDDFEAQAKEIVALYDKPIEHINAQVTDFVERQKAEKRKS